MKEVVICSALRTGIGSFQGQWSEFTAPELAAAVIKSIVNATQVTNIDECILGCVLTAGVGQAPARQALLMSGLSNTIPCTTVNKVCGSAMKAVAMGWDSIMLGNAEIVLAGGMESMSRAPYLFDTRNDKKMGHKKVLDHIFIDGLENAEDGKPMGYFAERCVDKYSYTREQQDVFSLASVTRANQATKQGLFKNEIIGIDGIFRDEQITKSNVNRIHKLKPVFKRLGGTVTAANSSSISDGAAVVLLSSYEYATQNKLPVLGVIRAHSSIAHAPENFTTAVKGAVTRVLKKCDWNISEVGLFEINEAFAVVVIAAMQDLQLTHKQVNVHGGACAMGHPIGASGCRAIVTLLHAMRNLKIRKGIASVCIGGGEAMAVALEVMDVSE